MKSSWLCFKQDWKWSQQVCILHPWLVLSERIACQGQGIAWWDYDNSSSQEVRNPHLWLALGHRCTWGHCGLVMPLKAERVLFLKWYSQCAVLCWFGECLGSFWILGQVVKCMCILAICQHIHIYMHVCMSAAACCQICHRSTGTSGIQRKLF